MHGAFGEDGRLQGLLDMLGVPYVFSGCLANSLAMNKKKTKLVAVDSGILVVPDIIIKKGESYNISDLAQDFSLPLVVKPIEAGSSVGVAIVQSKEQLDLGIKEAFDSGEEVMLEKYIKGRELTVSILGTDEPVVLPVIEIIPEVSGWYDYKAKYDTGGSRHICPANIDKDLNDQINDYSLKIFKALGCKDLARADFILSEDDGQLYFLEINTIPGMTKTSLAPESAKVHGLSFSDFLDKLIEFNLKA